MQNLLCLKENWSMFLTYHEHHEDENLKNINAASAVFALVLYSMPWKALYYKMTKINPKACNKKTYPVHPRFACAAITFSMLLLIVFPVLKHSNLYQTQLVFSCKHDNFFLPTKCVSPTIDNNQQLNCSGYHHDNHILYCCENILLSELLVSTWQIQ